MSHYHFHFNNSSSHCFSLLSSQFFSFPTFSSAICIPINWVEPSLIRSEILSTFGTCMCHSHFHLWFQQLFSHLSRLSFRFPSFLYLLFSRLYFNQLSGAIPDSIGNLVHLESLYVSLSFPSFLSTTDSSIFRKTYSPHLFFSEFYSNLLSGTIPDSIGNIVYLQNMYVLFILAFIATTLLTSTNHVQLFEFQSSEWSHPWFDRESCLPWESVCNTIVSSFLSTTLLLTSSHCFRLHSFLYPPSLQRVVFQSTEWSHPWFDREPCQTSGTVRITNNYLSHRVHFFVTPISSHLFFFHSDELIRFLQGNLLTGLIPDTICVLTRANINLDRNAFSCPYPKCCGCGLSPCPPMTNKPTTPE